MMKHTKPFYKTVKNVVMVALLLLTLDCHCMFLGVMQHVITKLPFARLLIAAMVKRSGQKQSAMSLKKIGLGAGGILTAALINKKQAKAEHVLYREDEDKKIIPLDENEYKEVDEAVVQKHQWPSAINHSKYNPDVDETKVIQEKLDQQFPGVKAAWIPDTLFDALEYETYLKSTYEEDPEENASKYLINTKIINLHGADLQKIAALTDQQKAMLFKHIAKKYSQSIRAFRYTDFPSDEIIDKTIDAEMECKTNHQTKTLFFRGYCKGVDFNEHDSFDFAKNQSEAVRAKVLAGEADTLKRYNGQSVRYDGAIALSYGQRLLENIMTKSGDCSGSYMTKDNRGFAVPLEKKELMNQNSRFFSLGRGFAFKSNLQRRPIFRHGPNFHPRAKAHVSEERPDIEVQTQDHFHRSDPQVTVHPTQQEARQAYADYFKEVMDKAIPLTEPTAEDIQKAKKAWDCGVAERNAEQTKQASQKGGQWDER